VSVPFENLFSPIKIGSMEVRNRIALAPMANYMSDERGIMNQPQIDFMEARAAGGTGLIIAGSLYVQHPHGRFGVGQCGLYEDSMIPAYKKMVDACHSHGAKVAAQIQHSGRQTTRAAIEGQQPVAPSPIAFGGKYSDVPRGISVADIQETVEAFGETARRAAEAGFDAFELHFAHGYLPCGFMSPFSNKRSDEYGGDLNGRMKFPLEILRKVKQVAGGRPVWCRIIGKELTEGGLAKGGLTIEDMKVIAKKLVDAGSDAISVSRGIAPFYWTVSNYYFPRGYSVPYAEAIREVVDVPVMTAGRITTPEYAEAILESGKADIINLGRALIADPEWPNKAVRGEVEDIMPCLSCNKGCHDPKKKVRHTTCLVNAAAGREVEFTLKPAHEPKTVMVVGGGLAGLEAARIAAIRGHHVTLYEKQDRFGGRWYLGSQVPHKEHFIEVVDFLSRQARKHGAKLELAHTATVQEVQEAKPDVLVVAVGASPLAPPIPGADQDFVVTVDDILSGEVTAGDRVVVVGGGSCGAETADYLCVRGHTVTVIEMLDEVCPDMLPDARYLLLERLDKAGVGISSSTTVLEIGDNSVVLSKQDPVLGVSWTTTIDNVDTVVLATGAKANREEADQFKDLAPQVFVIGDCVQPGFGIDAVYQGAKVAREI